MQIRNLKTLGLIAFSLCLADGVRAAPDSDPLAELAALGDSMAATGPEGGGSIRAKREPDTTRLARLQNPNNVEAKVEEVKLGKFPAVAIRVKVLKASRDGAGKTFKANDTIVVLPDLKAQAGKISMDDASTVINAGAFYLQEGDKVMVQLREKTNNVWKASYIERK